MVIRCRSAGGDFDCLVFLEMTTCTTTATTIITIYDTHGVVCCSWQNGALWEDQYLLPAERSLVGESMCVFMSCYLCYVCTRKRF